MVEISWVDLWSQNNLLLEYHDEMVDLTAFIFQNWDWFFNIFCIISYFHYKLGFIVGICRYIQYLGI